MRLRFIDPGLDALAIGMGPYWRLRLFAWADVIVFLCLNRSVWIGLGLGVAAAITEVWTWLAARPYLANHQGSATRRWVTMGAMLCFTATSSSVVVLFWNAGTEAMQLIAVASVFTILLHSQLFMSRSTAALLITCAAATGTLIYLVVFCSQMHGLQLISVSVFSLIVFAYVIVGGLVNQRSALALERARTEAVVANQAKSAFLAMMSHELRTPMNGVLGMAHALRLTDLNTQQAEHVDLLLQSGQGLMTILGDILDISKIEAGRLEFEAVPVDLTKLCDLTLDLWSTVASEKNVRLLKDIDPETPNWVMGDPTRLRQVITNLLSNALKFTEHGSVKLAVKPQPHEKQGYVRLELAVTDSGIGMSDEQISRLFQPFTQAEVSTTRQYGGTGLGLNICRRLAVMMHGDISVDSQLGIGSTFRVTVDLALTSAPSADEIEDVSDVNLEGLRLLVVDDNAVNRAVASAILGSVGALVETANDGVEALEALSIAHFDAVLMDVHMPRMDGVEALANIRRGKAGNAEIAVIALTADAMGGEDVRLMGVGFDAVQPKPIQPAELIATIAQLGWRSGRGAADLPLEGFAAG